jgi:hypothetical protein
MTMTVSVLRPSGWFRFGAALLLALIALEAPAQTYSVEIRPVLNDLDIKIEQIPQSTMLILRLTNNTDTRVRCQLVFDAAPQRLKRSTRSINPGRTISSELRAQRKWFRVIVDVTCTESSS